jgi:hypothetical protein
MIIAEIPYPISINGLFFPILSLQKPVRVFTIAAVLSATPSISERLVFEAPIESRNIGITAYTIFTDVSVRKLVNPVKKIFLLKPRILFSLLFSAVFLIPCGVDPE